MDLFRVLIIAFIAGILGNLPFAGLAWADLSWQVGIAEKFNHEMHEAKVFTPGKVQCSKCHNFSLEPSSGKLIPEAALHEQSLKLSLKKMCHECHQGGNPQFESAPKTCFTCHSSATSLSAIKPQNHSNVAWKKSHALEARIAGDSCLNCHTNSQCVKCHTRRNDIEFENHSRNFRFTHSIEARLQPQRCDACHTKSFCVNCHVGRK